jgi:electron transport complex protein RnfE
LMKAYFYSISEKLGIFIPLIVVNCIILGRAEAFASKNPVFLSASDGVGIGLGYTMSLFLISAIREILGKGTFVGMWVMWDSFEPFSFMVQAPGAFVCLGILLGIINLVPRKVGK